METEKRGDRAERERAGRGGSPVTSEERPRRARLQRRARLLGASEHVYNGEFGSASASALLPRGRRGGDGGGGMARRRR